MECVIIHIQIADAPHMVYPTYQGVAVSKKIHISGDKTL